MDNRRHLFRLMAIAFFAIVTAILMIRNIKCGIYNTPGYDFRLRYHEVECLRKGIDPYDIVTKRITSTEFALFGTPEAKPGVKTLHVYTPWEYTYFLPLSFLQETTAGAVFLTLSVFALAFVGVFVYRIVFELRKDVLDAIFAATSAMWLGDAVGEVLSVANYGALNAMIILLMLLALSARHDILAGVCWAFLMVKPQIGLLFAIPLLIRRKFVTMGVAVIVCVVSMIPPSLMCGRNPVEMLLEVPRGCSFVAVDNGTMLIPSQVFSAFSKYADPSLLGIVSMSIGAAICLMLTLRLRKYDSWFVFIAPAVVCAVLWNYCKPHDRVILWLPQALLAFVALQTKKRHVILLCLMLIFIDAWPVLPDDGVLPRLTRRLSLVGLLAFFWALPKTTYFKLSKKQNQSHE